MKKTIAIASILVMVMTFYACRKHSNPTLPPTTISGQDVTLNLPATTAKYYPGSDEMNRIATLGRVLFYDSHLSVNNAVSCGSCHKQAYGFADNTTFSFGFSHGATKRNTPGLTQLRESGSFFWDGRENDLNNLIMRPVTNPVEMGIEDASVLPAKLAALPYYHNLFGYAYGDSSITIERISQAVSQFLQAIGSFSSQSRFEQYNSGVRSALNAQEIQGMKLFDDTYNCKQCHGGGSSYSGNNTFKDIGLDAQPQDAGVGAVTGEARDNGLFKVPNLRNVALTAPYMHDGRFATLEQVVDHYDHDIKPSANLASELKDQDGNPKQFNISGADKDAIVAFLKALTDNGTATDPKFSDPFKAK